MKIMKDSDPFFKDFGKLDAEVFSDNVIPKKFKELSIISISIVLKCKECISFHVEEGVKSGADLAEIIEAT